ncbi:hypothetical protein PCANB_000196 [Pneumocystis canis]|nr:hypothetical protein PCANB_000196 [Pneumocystis canis]
MEKPLKHRELSELSGNSYDNLDTANDPLSVFFYEVNKIRRSQDKRRHRGVADGSPKFLNSNCNLSKKELSDIKAAAFFNRCYAGLQSSENLNQNNGIYIGKNSSFPDNIIGSVNTADEHFSIKMSLSDYKISNKNDLSKIMDSPLKSSEVYNGKCSGFSDNKLYSKEREELPLNIFKDENAPEKKYISLRNTKKNSEEKGGGIRKNALRSISLNIKDLITSIVSNIDHSKQSSIKHDDDDDVKKSTQNFGYSFDKSLSERENVLGAPVSFNEKNYVSDEISSKLYNKSLTKDKNDMRETNFPKFLKNDFENFVRNEKNEVETEIFKNSKDDYQMIEKNHEIYMNDKILEISDSDSHYKYESNAHIDEVKDNVQMLTLSIEDLSMNKLKESESFLPPLNFDIIETTDLGLDGFMINEFTDTSIGKANVFKNEVFKKDSILNQKKSDILSVKAESVKTGEESYVTSNTSDLLKTEVNSETSYSGIQEYAPCASVLDDNKSVGVNSRKVSYNVFKNNNVAVTLPILESQFLSDFDPTLDDVSVAIDKRGYIMRQNTKIVHAVSEDVSEENLEKGHLCPKLHNIYEKQEKVNEPSHDISIDKKTNTGLLFLRVLGIKNLELLPENEPLRFCCTLDNNKHYVTTQWMPLSKNAKIDEEFELVAYDDLEFTFTLRVDYEPKVIHKKKRNIFSKIFGYLKKRETVDVLNSFKNCLSNNGSFGRSYVSLKMLKDDAYGRSYITTIPCMNEWTKKSVIKGRNCQTLRVKPYIICQLRINAFYVPFVPGQKSLPKSLSACIKDIKNAEWICRLHYEGLLTQHGGDCLHRKKRYFRLTGLKLTSYHESTRSVRSNINLVKAVMVLNDRQLSVNSKLQNDIKDRGNKYSPLLESDGDYMFIECGFCIKFMNGEVINFYADSEDEKARWVRVLNAAIKKASEVKPWSLYVIHKQKVMKRSTTKSISRRVETCESK